MKYLIHNPCERFQCHSKPELSNERISKRYIGFYALQQPHRLLMSESNRHVSFLAIDLLADLILELE